jgi:hypothetical protein
MPVFGNPPPCSVVVVVGTVVVVVVDPGVVVVVVVDASVVVVVVVEPGIVVVVEPGIVVDVDVGVVVDVEPGIVVDVDTGVVVDVDAGVVVDVDVGVVVVVDVDVVAQIPFVMVLVSSVTAPFRANNCPCTVAPVVAVMDVKAKMCPTKWEFVPKVAEVPTFQKIRQYRAPLMRFTLLSDAVMSVEAVLNMKTASGSPWASSVRVPVIWNVPAVESYTPGVRVVPPSSVGMVVTGVLPAASSYAVTRSSLALRATPSARCTAPLKVTSACPGNAVPG